MQFSIERFELFPRSLELSRKLGGCHVVVGTPQFAGIFVSQFSCADILQFDEACVLVLHRRADGVPSDPESGQFLRVVRLRHDRGNLVDAHALCAWSRIASGWSVGAELAFAVHAGQLRRNLRLLGQEIGSLGAAGAFTCRSMIWRRSWVGSWT